MLGLNVLKTTRIFESLMHTSSPLFLPFQAKACALRVVDAMETLADITLASMVPGEIPIYITEQDGGSLIVELDTADVMSNSHYPMNACSMTLYGSVTHDPTQVVRLKVINHIEGFILTQLK